MRIQSWVTACSSFVQLYVQNLRKYGFKVSTIMRSWFSLLCILGLRFSAFQVYAIAHSQFVPLRFQSLLCYSLMLGAVKAFFSSVIHFFALLRLFLPLCAFHCCGAHSFALLCIFLHCFTLEFRACAILLFFYLFNNQSFT